MWAVAIRKQETRELGSQWARVKITIGTGEFGYAMLYKHWNKKLALLEDAEYLVSKHKLYPQSGSQISSELFAQLTHVRRLQTTRP